MSHYVNPDEVAAYALQVCSDVREVDPGRVYAGLVARCSREPERMAQVLVALAAWVDYDGPISALADRAEAITQSRTEAAS